MSRSIWRWLNLSASCKADNAAVASVKSGPEKSPHSRQTGVPGFAAAGAVIFSESCRFDGYWDGDGDDAGTGAGDTATGTDADNTGTGTGADTATGAGKVLAGAFCGAGIRRIISPCRLGCACTPCSPQPNPSRCITVNKITFPNNNIQNKFLITRSLPEPSTTALAAPDCPRRAAAH